MSGNKTFYFKYVPEVDNLIVVQTKARIIKDAHEAAVEHLHNKGFTSADLQSVVRINTPRNKKGASS